MQPVVMVTPGGGYLLVLFNDNMPDAMFLQGSGGSQTRNTGSDNERIRW
jgi:hypothetical protein